MLRKPACPAQRRSTRLLHTGFRTLVPLMITFILYKKITFLYLDLRLLFYAIFNVLFSIQDTEDKIVKRLTR